MDRKTGLTPEDVADLGRRLAIEKPAAEKNRALKEALEKKYNVQHGSGVSPEAKSAEATSALQGSSPSLEEYFGTARARAIRLDAEKDSLRIEKRTPETDKKD